MTIKEKVQTQGKAAMGKAAGILKDMTPEGKKRKRKIIGLIILGIVGVIAFFYLAGALWTRIEYGKSIKVSGNIEGNEVKISFRVAGLIDELLVDEGWYLQTGDVIARMDKSPFIRQRDEAAGALAYARAQYGLNKIDAVRAENLFREGAISAQQRDAAVTAAETNEADIERLEAALELAELNLIWTDLASPLNGFVTVKSALQGENVQVGAPVFTAIDMNDVWVSAYINETDLGKVHLNQKAIIKIDSFPHKNYEGWVSFISQQTEFTPKYIQTTKERVKYVYRIKVQADNESLDLKPGMPADAYIQLNKYVDHQSD